MGAFFETLVIVDAPRDEVAAIAGAAARRASGEDGWRLVVNGPVRFELGVRINWWTWGERVRITAEERSIRIRSWCPIQLVDWGKNRRNADSVRRHIRQARATRTRVRPVPSV